MKWAGLRGGFGPSAHSFAIQATYSLDIKLDIKRGRGYPETMSDEVRGEQTSELADRWDRVGARWDIASQRHFVPPTERLAELAGIQAGESVLDAGTCSGGIADFPDSNFDAVTWRLSAFLLLELIAGLRESWRVVKPGGRVGVSIPGPTNMEPLRSMYLTRLQSYGGDGQARQGRRPVVSPETCYDALREAGFERIEVRAEQLGSYLDDAGEWWEILQGTGLDSFHACLSRRKLSRFKAEHLAEITKLATSRGIWLDLAVIFALGWKQS